ncbi:polysaccharide biosynthesis protein [Tateyamaria sp.]|nr:polysaccharide biosynthesis protein [Tateyamaria sp.]
MVVDLSFFNGAKVAITGGGGTVGKELGRQLLALGASEIRALDNSEIALWDLEGDNSDERLIAFLVDITKEDHLKRYFMDVDYVFHAAALKHVPFCEKHPQAAIETNLHGVEAVINAALACDVKRVLFTSSDKAVNSTNLMGATKFVGERIMTSSNNLVSKEQSTRFASTRFGNVAMSNGSVIPRFIEQIKKGRPITLTDASMTRFMMSIEESVKLVIDSMAIMRGGEVFVTQMPVIKIGDLAGVLVEELADKYGHDAAHYPITITGARPGEKLYEELTTDEEVARSWEIENMIVVLPAFRNIYGYIDYSSYENDGTLMTKVYHSHYEPALDKAGIRDFLNNLNIFEQ